MGVSRVIRNTTQLKGARVGTPLYLSPEIIKKQAYDFKIDIWAFGCVIYYLASLEPPFVGENFAVLSESIINKQPKELPKLYSNALNSFVNKLLIKKASDRPSTKILLKMFPSFTVNKETEHKMEPLMPAILSKQMPADYYSPVKSNFESHIPAIESYVKPTQIIHTEQINLRPSTVNYSILKSPTETTSRSNYSRPTEGSSQPQKNIDNIMRPALTRASNRRIILCFNQQKSALTTKSKLTLSTLKDEKNWNKIVDSSVDPQRPISAGLDPRTFKSNEIKKPEEKKDSERPHTVLQPQIRSPMQIFPRMRSFKPTMNHMFGMAKPIGFSIKSATSIIRMIDLGKKEPSKLESKKLTILDL